MKNVHIFSCLLLTSITAHCMEQNQIDFWKGIDYRAVEQSLQDNYKNYLKHNLELYKNGAQANFDELIDMSNLMIGQSNGIDFLRQTHDEQNNLFIHAAVNNRDLPAVQYLLTKDAANQWGSNIHKQMAFDLCIEQLLPQAIDNEQNKKSTSLEMLAQIINNMIKCIDHKELIKKCITKLISLELACYAHQSSVNAFVKGTILEELLVKASDKNQPLSLNTLYQQITDQETGNTMSHVAVGHQKADHLYGLITRDCVSPARNKEGLTVADIALKKFQFFTQEPSLFEMQKEEATQSRCCLFMLRKFILLKQKDQAFDITCNCCDQHVITGQ